MLALFLLAACQDSASKLPTRVPKIQLELARSMTHRTGPGSEKLEGATDVPATWTPVANLDNSLATPRPTATERLATMTPLPIPTNTPLPPTYTPTATPNPTLAPGLEESVTPDLKPLIAYRRDEVIPIAAFPRPPGDNGWGIHWIPSYKQDKDIVDRFVNQVIRMHIKWVVFLNDGTNIGDNDYLVERLVASGIMPVMRLFRSNVTPYDGDLGPMVAHYRAKGVYYFQLYNEPNVNAENDQGFPSPSQYAVTWAAAARDVINNGGFPGIGALSPGGAYNHYSFLDRTLSAMRWNGDLGLLNWAWLSVHNYHGLRALDDPDGFLLFRRYDEIVREQLQRSLPMIGTEGGSYSPDSQVERDLISIQYQYMREAEPYLFAFSHWLLANREGGHWDPQFEWQALFRDGFVHPLVTDFFYRNRR